MPYPDNFSPLAFAARYGSDAWDRELAEEAERAAELKAELDAEEAAFDAAQRAWEAANADWYPASIEEAERLAIHAERNAG